MNDRRCEIWFDHQLDAIAQGYCPVLDPTTPPALQADLSMSAELAVLDLSDTSHIKSSLSSRLALAAIVQSRRPASALPWVVPYARRVPTLLAAAWSTLLLTALAVLFYLPLLFGSGQSISRITPLAPAPSPPAALTVPATSTTALFHEYVYPGPQTGTVTHVPTLFAPPRP